MCPSVLAPPRWARFGTRISEDHPSDAPFSGLVLLISVRHGVIIMLTPGGPNKGTAPS